MLADRLTVNVIMDVYCVILLLRFRVDVYCPIRACDVAKTYPLYSLS
jgi:hypothetical protein